MVRVDKCLQAFLKDMRINLGRRNVSMAEKLLNGPKISPAVKQVTRERMT